MGKRGNKKGRAPRPSDYENLKKTVGKQTGPITEEGKEICSMNAVQTGEYLKNFHRISRHAGRMAICDNCGDEQKALCMNEKKCLLQDYFIVEYHKAFADRDVKRIEDINSLLIPNMVFIFNAKLKYALDNVEEVYLDKFGNEHHKVDYNYILMLLNMFTTLNMKLEDMQMTRKTMVIEGSELRALLERAGEDEDDRGVYKQIVSSLDNLVQGLKRGEKMRAEDKTVQDFEKTVAGQSLEDNLDLDKVGGNPFGEKKE